MQLEEFETRILADPKRRAEYEAGGLRTTVTRPLLLTRARFRNCPATTTREPGSRNGTQATVTRRFGA
jgi:hypothetical protein